MTGATLAWGGLDLEGDGQPGTYIGVVQDDATKPQQALPGLENVVVMTLHVTKSSLPPSGRESMPYNLLGKVMTVEGCAAVTGLRRNVTVTP